MTRYRPTSVLVLAILSCIFGSFGLICGLGALVMVPFQASMQQGANARVMNQLRIQLPGGDTAQYLLQGLGVVLAGILLLSGIGMLSMQPWARLLGLLHALLILVLNAGNLLWNAAFVYPLQSRLVNAEVAQFRGNLPPEDMFLPMVPALALGGAVFGAVIALAYALTEIIILTRPRVVSAFAGKAPPPPANVDVEDYHDRRDPAPGMRGPESQGIQDWNAPRGPSLP